MTGFKATMRCGAGRAEAKVREKSVNFKWIGSTTGEDGLFAPTARERDDMGEIVEKMRLHRFTCSKRGEQREFFDTLDGAVRRARNLYWRVTVIGTAEHDLSFVLCPLHHARKEAANG